MDRDIQLKDLGKNIMIPTTVGGITLLAAFVRFLNLGRESLWWDEVISVVIARSNTATFFHVLLHYEANMALYYLVLRGWLLFGSSEWVVRSLSAIAGTFAVPLLFVLARRLFGTTAALVATLLFSLNAFHVYYSQEARAYGLLVFFVVASSLTFVYAVEEGRHIYWIAYAIATTAAAYCHIFGFLLLPVHWISFCFLVPYRRQWRSVLAASAAVLAATAPLLLAIASEDTEHLAWLHRPDKRAVYQLYLTYAGTHSLSLVLFVSVLVAGFTVLWKWSKGETDAAVWRLVLVLNWALLPVLVGFLVSLRTPVFVDRYLIVVLPAVPLILGYGVSRLRSVWIVVPVAAVLAFSSARNLVHQNSYLVKEDWRGVTAKMLADAAPSDGLIFYLGPGASAFRYYSELAGRGNESWKVFYPDRDHWDTYPAPAQEPLRRLAEQVPRIWIVESHTSARRLVEKQLIESIASEQHPVLVKTSFRGIDVLLYSRP